MIERRARTLVRKERLELSRRKALEPKSSASTNSATFAREPRSIAAPFSLHVAGGSDPEQTRFAC